MGGYWIWLYNHYSSFQLKEIKICGDGNKDYFFCCNMSYMSRNQVYNFNYVMATMSALVWIKVLTRFFLTRTMGPLIKIVALLLADVSKFMLIWSLALLLFICVGMLVFFNVPQF